MLRITLPVKGLRAAGCGHNELHGTELTDPKNWIVSNDFPVVFLEPGGHKDAIGNRKRDNRWTYSTAILIPCSAKIRPFPWNCMIRSNGDLPPGYRVNEEQENQRGFRGGYVSFGGQPARRESHA